MPDKMSHPQSYQQLPERGVLQDTFGNRFRARGPTSKEISLSAEEFEFLNCRSFQLPCRCSGILKHGSAKT